MNYLQTTGLDYYPLTYKLVDGGLINVHIWDTCGQERYDAIWEKYYKQADGILLVFDISNKESFNKIKKFYAQKIKDNCKLNIPIILLGNKTDLNDEREVTEEEAINLAIKEEYFYKETSCLLNENVADAFETIIEMWNIYNKKINQPPNPIKRSKSKESMESDDSIIRSDSFILSDRNYSLQKNKTINDDEESQKINLNKKSHKKKKKKRFC